MSVLPYKPRRTSPGKRRTYNVDVQQYEDYEARTPVGVNPKRGAWTFIFEESVDEILQLEQWLDAHNGSVPFHVVDPDNPGVLILVVLEEYSRSRANRAIGNKLQLQARCREVRA